MLRTITIYLVAATALFAFLLPAQDSDGSLVVMDRLYYEQCKSDFYSDCAMLSSRVDSFESYSIPMIESVTNRLGSALSNTAWAGHYVDLIVNNGAEGDRALAIYAEQYIDALRGELVYALSQSSSLLSESQTFISDMRSIISVTSNTFPLEVTSTNLTLVVVVSNYFEMASNELDHAQNVYTNFLNYYRGVEDYMLDQYRATVTNLLDASLLIDQINHTAWGPPYQSSSGYLNINWGKANTLLTTLSASTLWSINPRQNPWMNYIYPLNADQQASVTLQEFLSFSLIGMHDSINALAYDYHRSYLLLTDAMTNTTYSIATVASSTNAFVSFLRAPSGYDAQVNNVARSRNWFQRIELWLSSIARNTDMGESDEGENADSRDDSQEVYDVISNDVATASVRVNELFVPLASLTNATAGVQSLVDSVTDVLDNFKSTPGVRSSGLRSGDSSAPATFKLMSTGFIESTFERSDLHPSSLPDWVGCDDTNEVFGFARTAATWIHHFFGVIWLASAIALLVFYARWLSSWVVTLWYRLLGFLAKICTFTWGGS